MANRDIYERFESMRANAQRRAGFYVWLVVAGLVLSLIISIGNVGGAQ